MLSGAEEGAQGAPFESYKLAAVRLAEAVRLASRGNDSENDMVLELSSAVNLFLRESGIALAFQDALGDLEGVSLPAAFPVANLPIYFSSGDDRRMQRARATTARYGRDSAAAGQGARARSRQRAEGATVGCTNGEAGIHPGASADQVKWAGVRGYSAHNCNLRLPAICRKHSCSGFGELPQPSGRGPAARRLFCWPSHPPRVGQMLDARRQREAGQPHWSLAAAGGRSTARGYLRLFL